MRYHEPFFVDRVGPLLTADYLEAQRQVGDEDRWVVWPARIQADIDLGLSDEASLAKHRRVWRQALGLDAAPAPAPGPAQTSLTRLRRAGRWLESDAGRFTWRMVSAFRLCHMVAQGEDIRPFLDWCQLHRVGVRVFTMCHNLFVLPPETRRTTLPTVLALAAERGCYVEVVALVDTVAYPSTDCGRHVENVGAICASFDNSLLEGCNEPLQPWQPFSPSTLDDWLIDVSATVPRTLGASDGGNDESTAYIVPQSSYGVSHTDRAGTAWRRVRHIREQQVAADHLGLYMVDDEPENAKQLTEAQLFAAGAIAAVCGIGQTHHADFGKTCRLPTADEQRQFDARRRGWDSVPAGFRGTFSNYGWRTPLPEHPVEQATLLDGESRVYASVTDQEAYVVLSHAETPTFRAGWQGVRVDGLGDASVWQCHR